MGGHLITGGRLLDATGAAPQDGVSVLVEGNRIRKIGPDREVAAAAESLGGYRTIDAAGHTVMPGMIDGHCHISYGDILSFEEARPLCGCRVPGRCVPPTTRAKCCAPASPPSPIRDQPGTSRWRCATPSTWA